MSTQLGINRRQMIQGLSATLGAFALRGFTVNAAANAHFTHGIASGDPLADRVILWTRVLPGDGAATSLDCQWQVAEDAAFTRVIASGTRKATAEHDFTVKVDAIGLKPSHRYFYRFIANDEVSPVGRTTTLPVGQVARFRMGVCSCSNYPQGYFNAYQDMARAELDVVLHLGDYIYEYADGVYSNPVATEALGRHVEPRNELLRVEDYRMRYGLYRTDQDLQAAHAAHPWICVWDDHELANDTYKDGAENHNEGEGDFYQRMAAARRVYHEWLPIRTAAQSDQLPIYRQFPVGDLADIIMLDTRLEGRDKQLDYRLDMPEPADPARFKTEVLADPARTILGADQEQWLVNQLAASKVRGATWQVIGQQVLMGEVIVPKFPEEMLAAMDVPERTKAWIMGMNQLAEFDMPWNLDAWNGYIGCRNRVYEAFTTLASNPVVLAGDTHNAWAFNLSNSDGQAVGVEIGCPGISSPGLETYLPLPVATVTEALLKSSPELVDVDTAQRGWAEVTLTPEATTSQWHFVSTVLDKAYTVIDGELLRCEAGARRFG